MLHVVLSPGNKFAPRSSLLRYTFNYIKRFFFLHFFQEACLVVAPIPLDCLANSNQQEHLARRQEASLVLRHQAQLDLAQDLVQLQVSLDRALVDRRYA